MSTDNAFFDRPILNSPYELPARHWELDPSGQPAGRIVERRRGAEFITPIPKPKKRRQNTTQAQMVFDREAAGLSSADQQYDPTPVINDLRRRVDLWRALPNPSHWNVLPRRLSRRRMGGRPAPAARLAARARRQVTLITRALEGTRLPDDSLKASKISPPEMLVLLVTNMLPIVVVEIREYIAADGGCRYARWFEELDAGAAAKVAIALTRMAQGNFSNAKGVSGGVYEYRIDFGPGYRIYFGKDGPALIILLGGGTKKRQQSDIRQALKLWSEYKSRKRKEI